MSSPDTLPPVVDPSQLWERLDGDRELLQVLLDAYRTETPALLAEIQTGITTRQALLVERAAHSLKGSTSVFSAPRALSVATTLEQVGRSGNFEDAAAAYQQMLTAVADLLRTLEALAAEDSAAPSS